MANNIITLLLEGPHDAAFLYKILKCNGFSEIRGPIKELPPPVFGLLSNPKHLSSVKVEEMTFDFANRRIYPFDILKDESENIILLYPLQGDGNRQLREELIKTFDDAVIEDPEAYNPAEGFNFSFLYFLDGDNKGIETRINEINTELRLFFPDKEFDNFTSNKSIRKIGDVGFGVYIITEYQKETGKLEDILLPIMREKNEDIFEKAEQFLSIHEQTELFKANLQKDDQGKILKVNNVRFDYKKSLVGTVGQLQKSGMNNTVCIKQTNFLNDEKIKANAVCADIITFIKQVSDN